MSASRETEQAPVYGSDDRKLFCCNCGRAAWLHYRVIGSGLFCDPVTQPADIPANPTQDKGA